MRIKKHCVYFEKRKKQLFGASCPVPGPWHPLQERWLQRQETGSGTPGGKKESWGHREGCEDFQLWAIRELI